MSWEQVDAWRAGRGRGPGGRADLLGSLDRVKEQLLLKNSAIGFINKFADALPVDCAHALALLTRGRNVLVENWDTEAVQMALDWLLGEGFIRKSKRSARMLAERPPAYYPVCTFDLQLLWLLLEQSGGERFLEGLKAQLEAKGTLTRKQSVALRELARYFWFDDSVVDAFPPHTWGLFKRRPPMRRRDESDILPPAAPAVPK